MNNPYIVQTSTIYVQAAFDNNFTADVRGVLLDTSKAFDKMNGIMNFFSNLNLMVWKTNYCRY